MNMNMNMNNGEFLKQMGARIRAARMKKGISIKHFSKLHSMDFSSISRIETGLSNVQILTLRKIADALDVEVQDFILK